jgi:hypothetical protein
MWAIQGDVAKITDLDRIYAQIGKKRVASTLSLPMQDISPMGSLGFITTTSRIGPHADISCNCETGKTKPGKHSLTLRAWLVTRRCVNTFLSDFATSAELARPGAGQ